MNVDKQKTNINNNEVATNKPKFSLQCNTTDPSKNQIEVKIEAKEFVDKSVVSSLFSTKEGWFVNLTGVVIPKKVQFLL